MSVQAEWQALLGATGTVWFIDGVAGDNDADGLTPDTPKLSPLHESVTYANNQGLVFLTATYIAEMLDLSAYTGLTLTSTLGVANGSLTSDDGATLKIRGGHLNGLVVHNTKDENPAFTGPCVWVDSLPGELLVEDCEITSLIRLCLGVTSAAAGSRLTVRSTSMTGAEGCVGIQAVAGPMTVTITDCTLLCQDYYWCNIYVVYLGGGNHTITASIIDTTLTAKTTELGFDGADDIACLGASNATVTLRDVEMLSENENGENAKDVYGINLNGTVRAKGITIQTINPSAPGANLHFAAPGSGALKVIDYGSNDWNETLIDDAITFYAYAAGGGVLASGRRRGRERARIIGGGGIVERDPT